MGTTVKFDAVAGQGKLIYDEKRDSLLSLV